MARIAPFLVGWRPYALLAVLCLALYLPGIARSRCSTATRPGSPRRRGRCWRPAISCTSAFRTKRATRSRPASIGCRPPPSACFSDPKATAIWPYRLPSLIGASLAVLLTFGLGRALLGEAPEAAPPRRDRADRGDIARRFTRCMAEAHIAKTDAVLLAAVVAGAGSARPCLYARAPWRAGRHWHRSRVLGRRNRRDPAQGAGRAGAGGD